MKKDTDRIIFQDKKAFGYFLRASRTIGKKPE